MTRVQFTFAIARLIAFAESQQIPILLDWVKRDRASQRRMFDDGLSKCDGTIKISQHQRGRAADIYIIENGQISNDAVKYKLLHDYWLSLGGSPALSWDAGHFEAEG